MTPEMRELMEFYDVGTLEDLIDEQEKHIVRLQNEIPPRENKFPPSYRKG